MKKIILLIALGLLVASVISLTAAPLRAEEAIDVKDSKYENLFVFRTDRKYLGAKVEVYAMNGDLITAQRLNRRKMIIDFCDVKFGEYTIRIVKGEVKEEYRYVKK